MSHISTLYHCVPKRRVCTIFISTCNTAVSRDTEGALHAESSVAPPGISTHSRLLGTRTNRLWWSQRQIDKGADRPARIRLNRLIWYGTLESAFLVRSDLMYLVSGKNLRLPAMACLKLCCLSEYAGNGDDDGSSCMHGIQSLQLCAMAWQPAPPRCIGMQLVALAQ